MTRSLVAILVFSALSPIQASEYFVSTAGQDSNSGADSQNAFLTIQHGVDVAKGGDTVTVLDGVYHESVKITHSGDRGAPVTIRSQNRWGAKLIAPNVQSCIEIGGPNAIGVAYITIDGFDVVAPGSWGNGVVSSYKAHHITVQNVYAHNCGSGGVGLGDGDYRVVRNCVCAYNSFLMRYCASGISFWGQVKADDAPGFHNIISGNVCYGNNNDPKTLQTDGNGIIIDDFRDIQRAHSTTPDFDLHYQGAATLVENNLCFHNGARGVEVYSSNNVTVVNNTCVRNLRRANQGDKGNAEIVIGCAANIVVANNIGITSTGPSDPANHSIVSAYGFVKTNGKEYPDDTTMQGTLTVENNLSFDESKPRTPSFYVAAGLTVPFAGLTGNLAGVDPGLINPDDPSLWGAPIPPDTNFESYFGLKKNSPAIGAGIKIDGASFAGQRVIDLGAIQQGSAQ